jgi:hypothetical protein
LKRSALAVVSALLLGLSLLASCSSDKPDAGSPTGGPTSGAGGGGPTGGTGGNQATAPDPCSLVTPDEAATALGTTAGSLTKDTHENEANGVITHVCDYNDDQGGTVEIAVAPGSYDQNEITTIQAAYRNSQLLSIGDGGIIFSLGGSSTAVEFWAHGLKVQVGSTSFSSKAQDTATAAKSLANAALGRLP